MANPRMRARWMACGLVVAGVWAATASAQDAGRHRRVPSWIPQGSINGTFSGFTWEMDGQKSWDPGGTGLDREVRAWWGGQSGPMSLGHPAGNFYGATFDVPFGHYSGDHQINVHSTSWDSTIGGGEGSGGAWSDFRLSEGVHGYNGAGWSFEQEGGLVMTWDRIGGSQLINSTSALCYVVPRYAYYGEHETLFFQAKGVEPVCGYTITSGTCDSNSGPVNCVWPTTAVPTHFWSTQGQVDLDVSGPQPVMRYPDGRKETLAAQGPVVARYWYPTPRPAGWSMDADSTGYLVAPAFPGLDGKLGQMDLALPIGWVTSQVEDVNGNVTRYAYDPLTHWLTSITEPSGRTTRFARDYQARVTSIEQDGPGGQALRWSLTWSTFRYSPNPTFGDDWMCTSMLVPYPCDDQSYSTLTQLTVPDGRSYVFKYGPWGNLTYSSTPDGVVTTYEYTDGSQTLFAPPGFGVAGGNLAYGSQRRALWKTTVHPKGAAGPGYTTTVTHESIQSTGLSALGTCAQLQWIRTTFADGTYRRIAYCVDNQGSWMGPSLDGVHAAEELHAPSGALLEGVYFASTGAVPDPSVPVGTTYYSFQTASSVPNAAEPAPASGATSPAGGAQWWQQGGAVLDLRPYKVVHFHDGLTWTETFAYDGSSIPADNGAFRTLGNVVDHQILQDGALLFREQRTFVTGAAYAANNLLRLPLTVQVSGPLGVASSQRFAYDEVAPSPSGAPGLDLQVTGARGNVTSAITYADATGGTQPVTAATRYFDNGAVQSSADGRGGTTTSGYDFALCSAAHRTAATFTINALGQQTTTVRDCISGAVLSVTDPNGQRTCTQYDRFGRELETALPGDTLTALADSCQTCTVANAFLCGGETANSCAAAFCECGAQTCAAGQGPFGTTQLASCIDASGNLYCPATCTRADAAFCGTTPRSCSVTDCGRCGGGAYLRDPACPTSPGTAPGRGGLGPTTWSEYLDQGTMTGTAWQREVHHTKNGTAAGTTTISFRDGLGREIERCASVDPAASGGNAASCTATDYSLTGLKVRTIPAFFVSSLPAAPASPPAGRPFTYTGFDGLGRGVVTGMATSSSTCNTCAVRDGAACGSTCGTCLISDCARCGTVQMCKSCTTSDLVFHNEDCAACGVWPQVMCRTCAVTDCNACGAVAATCSSASCETCGGEPAWSSPPARSSYSGGGVTVSTDARGDRTRTTVDVLGRVTRVERATCAQGGCTTNFQATTMQYDARNALVSSTDPLGNVLQAHYDGLGRRTSLADPDRGSWTYGYDGAGNLVSRTDARGQVVRQYYDALNRLQVIDFPPSGPGVEDEVDTYDGNLPSCAPLPCASSWVDAQGRVSTAVCCDDHDPGTTDSCDPQTLTCRNVAAGCTQTGACTPGSTRATACGNCGTETDTCTSSCTWAAGTCTGQGACAPGATRSASCGTCGTETDTCSSTCQWTAGTCTTGGACTPGATRSVPCGNCGTETDTCSSSCQWTAGTCSNQGPCAPGATRTVGCGNCGTEQDTCSTTCQWTAGTCGGQGVCSPGATRTSSCTDSAGMLGSETDTCSSTCGWSAGACRCTPGASIDCDPSGLCNTCTGTCTMGTMTCSTSGTWGSCSGARCTLDTCNPPMICN